MTDKETRLVETSYITRLASGFSGDLRKALQALLSIPDLPVFEVTIKATVVGEVVDDDRNDPISEEARALLRDIRAACGNRAVTVRAETQGQWKEKHPVSPQPTPMDDFLAASEEGVGEGDIIQADYVDGRGRRIHLLPRDRLGSDDAA